MKDTSLKRISIMIREDQIAELSNRNLNLSGLIRDLLDDHLSNHAITLSVSEETKKVYDKIVSNTGSTDQDVEVYLKDSLKALLKDKINEMMSLEKQVFGEN